MDPKEKPVYVDKQVGQTVFMVVLMLFLDLVSYQLIETAFDYNPPPREGLAAGLIIVSLSFWLLYNIGKMTTRFFYSDRVVIKSLYGKELHAIYYKDLIRWYRLRGAFQIYFMSAEKSFGLEFMSKDKMKLLVPVLSAYQKEDFVYAEQKRKRNTKLVYAYVILGVSLMFYAMAAGAFFSKGNEISPKELVTIKRTISQTPEIESGAHSAKFLNLHVKESPDFLFNLSGFSIHASDQEALVKDVQVGDTVELNIMRTDLESHLLRIRPLPYYDRVFWESHSISVYGIRKHREVFLSLNDYNRESDQGNIWMVLGGIATVLLLCSVYFFFKAANIEKAE